MSIYNCIARMSFAIEGELGSLFHTKQKIQHHRSAMENEPVKEKPAPVEKAAVLRPAAAAAERPVHWQLAEKSGEDLRAIAVSGPGNRDAVVKTKTTIETK